MRPGKSRYPRRENFEVASIQTDGISRQKTRQTGQTAINERDGESSARSLDLHERQDVAHTLTYTCASFTQSAGCPFVSDLPQARITSEDRADAFYEKQRETEETAFQESKKKKTQTEIGNRKFSDRNRTCETERSSTTFHRTERREKTYRKSKESREKRKITGKFRGQRRRPPSDAIPCWTGIAQDDEKV